MDANIKNEERKELINIYNGLSSPLKKQLLMLARVVDTTREMTLNENNWKKSEHNI